MKHIFLTLLFVSISVLNAQTQIEETTHESLVVTEEKGTHEVDWQSSFEAAINKAKEINKPVLIYFTGSDWCGPCMRLDKELFHTEKFKVFSKENMVLYKANYPRNSDLVTKENRRINEELSIRYGQSSFPTMIVVNADGVVLGRKDGTYVSDYYYPFFDGIIRDFY